ncbi:MAG: polysulfide reductase NrfD [Alphaproteobacteria bacterium]|jgi:formate-dependent nitrite reductase membrane component NrfD|nr:polysulfide reductase NrfD [Alphaproteobacteria bacterium]MBT7941823.1 polysulfide reductase NrfD [Alphaproteobacteria bacterium]
MELELNWGLPVIMYLFLAGVGAGAVTVSASVLLRGGGGGFAGSHFSLARYGAIIGPFPVMLGTFLIIFELGRPFRMMNLFKVVNLSPMNIGSWLLLLFILISVLYALAFLPTFFSNFQELSKRLAPVRTGLAWLCVPLGIGVAVYTGIMLGAMPARPFWNSPILALLFLVSALSTGVAIILLFKALFPGKTKKEPGLPMVSEYFRKSDQSAYILTSSDLLLIGFELMVIFLFVLFAHLTVGNVKYAVSTILPGGQWAGMFWLWVVLIGLIIPALVELFFVIPKLLYHREYSAPRVVEILVPVAVLIGGFMLRYIVVIVGQVTGPVGL